MSRILEGFGYLCCAMAMVVGAQSAAAVLEPLPLGLCIATTSCALNTNNSCADAGAECKDNECICEEHDTTNVCNCKEI